MKILLLSVMYPSPAFPSFGVFVKNWEDGLRAGGIDVSRVVINRQASGLRKFILFASYSCRAVRAVLRRDTDIIYVHFVTLSLFPLVFVAPLIRVPLVLNAHGTDVMSHNWISRLILRCNKTLIERAELIVVPSEYMRREVGIRIRNPRIFVSASSGVNSDSFSPNVLGAPESDAIRLGFVSRLIRTKGWRDFLMAVHILRNSNPGLAVSAEVVGSGTDIDEFYKVRSELDLERIVAYSSEINQEALAAWYRRLTLLIFPSHLPESLGLVGLEAMACGVPVIGSSIGAIPSYVRSGETGFLFSPGKPDEIVCCVEKYMALDHTTKQLMRENCLREAALYRSDAIAESLIRELRTHAKVGCLY